MALAAAAQPAAGGNGAVWRGGRHTDPGYLAAVIIVAGRALANDRVRYDRRRAVIGAPGRALFDRSGDRRRRRLAASRTGDCKCGNDQA
jgi:hypothetical protein